MEEVGDTVGLLSNWPNYEFIEAGVCIVFSSKRPLGWPRQENLSGRANRIAVAQMTANDVTMLVSDCHVKVRAIQGERSG